MDLDVFYLYKMNDTNDLLTIPFEKITAGKLEHKNVKIENDGKFKFWYSFICLYNRCCRNDVSAIRFKCQN